jgi:small subunit ribosomal protein S4
MLASKFGKTSGFGLQLRKKQAAKRMFGITERQFSNYYHKALRMNGVLGENMLSLLERRLDNAMFKANFARTIMQARQFVSHGHFLVNGQKVDIPSYAVSAGDVITIREKMKESPAYKTLVLEFEEFVKTNANGSVSAAKWLEIDAKKLTVTVKSLPAKEDFDQVIDVQKIIEFYSR